MIRKAAVNDTKLIKDTTRLCEVCFESGKRPGTKGRFISGKRVIKGFEKNAGEEKTWVRFS